MPDGKGFELASYGQSIWLDYISRSLIKSGKLEELIKSGLRGMTSNPTIFEKAIKGSRDYDEEIARFASAGKSTFEIYDEITVRDIQDAADIFRPVYEETKKLDGYVSLEVNPLLANDTAKTIKEAKRLHGKVNRPNVMFKVPSTDQGFSAIEELVASGMNVNITLIFSLEQYNRTARSFLRGIERFINTGGIPDNIRSVASVFVSRIDTLIDKLLDEKISGETDNAKKEHLRSLKGKAAVANSALIYDEYKEIFSSPEFGKFAGKGAKIERVLWGSTSAKNPEYKDIKYVSELIGKDTVNTMPQETFEAFLDHGRVKEALPGDVREKKKIISELKSYGIDPDTVCRTLLHDGVAAFKKSFTSLLNSIDEKI